MLMGRFLQAPVHNHTAGPTSWAHWGAQAGAVNEHASQAHNSQQVVLNARCSISAWW